MSADVEGGDPVDVWPGLRYTGNVGHLRIEHRLREDSVELDNPGLPVDERPRERVKAWLADRAETDAWTLTDIGLDGFQYPSIVRIRGNGRWRSRRPGSISRRNSNRK